MELEEVFLLDNPHSNTKYLFSFFINQVQDTERSNHFDFFFNLISRFTPQCLKEGEPARHTVNKWKLRSSYLLGNLSSYTNPVNWNHNLKLLSAFSLKK